MGERVFTASKIYSLMRLYFSGWKSLPELDLDIAYLNDLEKALATDNRREFDLATMEFVARLRNGQTVLWDSWLPRNYGQGMERSRITWRGVIEPMRAARPLNPLSLFPEQKKPSDDRPQEALKIPVNVVWEHSGARFNEKRFG